MTIFGTPIHGVKPPGAPAPSFPLAGRRKRDVSANNGTEIPIRALKAQSRGMIQGKKVMRRKRKQPLVRHMKGIPYLVGNDNLQLLELHQAFRLSKRYASPIYLINSLHLVCLELRSPNVVRLKVD